MKHGFLDDKDTILKLKLKNMRTYIYAHVSTYVYLFKMTIKLMTVTSKRHQRDNEASAFHNFSTYLECCSLKCQQNV